MKKTYLVLVILIVLLSACNAGNNTIEKAPEDSSPGEGYPITQQPGSAENISPTWTPDPTMGTVDGILTINGQPVSNVNLFLAGVVTDAEGRELVAGYDRTSPIHANTNMDGYFQFQNVIPGRYGLVLDLVNTAYLLDFPDGSASILLTVETGKNNPLGTLDYKELPGL